jgi:hypothetical protein
VQYYKRIKNKGRLKCVHHVYRETANNGYMTG